MKKITSALMMLAAVIAMVSCQNNDELVQQPTVPTEPTEKPTEPAEQPLVINAVAEGVGSTGSRAEMAYKYDLLWSPGDQIYLKSSTANATATLQDGAGTKSGTFTCATNPFSDGTEVEAIYPTSLVNGDRLLWPTDQTLNTSVPMYCKETLSDTGKKNFSFKSLGCVLQIVFNEPIVSSSYRSLKSIKIEDGEKTLSGTFIIDNEGKAVITAHHKAGITLDLGPSGVQMHDEKVGFFNIVVPAGTYSNLKLTFTDNYGQESVLTSTTPLTFRHNAVAKLTISTDHFNYHKSYTGYAKANIEGDPVDVEWVQLWHGGPKFAVYNVGVTDANIENFGGFYFWGSTVNRDTNLDNYNNSLINGLTGNDDTATALWGSNWRMPTSQELEALLDNCDMEEVELNGVKCAKFTGKETSSSDFSENSIYLPLAGHTREGIYHAFDSGDHDYNPPMGSYDINYKTYYTYSYYWSSSAYPSRDEARCLTIGRNRNKPFFGNTEWGNTRNSGCSVRAVLK